MKELLKKLARDQALSEAQTFELFELLISPDQPGAATEGMIGAYLFATAVRLPTADELTGAARALRKHMVAFPERRSLRLLDTCGTGGSGRDTFNTSTVSALVAAAAGQPVAKHGNRAVTSRCGSADLLTALGIPIELTPEAAAAMLKRSGFAFLSAPAYHPATKRVAAVRKELGFRTIFNIIGPLCNPAEPVYQLVGVSDERLLPIVCETLLRLGTERALVVHALDGLDEISLCGATAIYELKSGAIRNYVVEPESFGFTRQPPSAFEGGTALASANRATALLGGEASPYSDIVLLNAGAALYVSGHAETIGDGIAIAEKTIASGAALRLIEALTQR